MPHMLCIVTYTWDCRELHDNIAGTVLSAQAKLKLALQEWVVFILMTGLYLNESLTKCQTITFMMIGNTQLP
jgi:hypothetical protein